MTLTRSIHFPLTLSTRGAGNVYVLPVCCEPPPCALCDDPGAPLSLVLPPASNTPEEALECEPAGDAVAPLDKPELSLLLANLARFRD